MWCQSTWQEWPESCEGNQMIRSYGLAHVYSCEKKKKKKCARFYGMCTFYYTSNFKSTLADIIILLKSMAS